jgi:hypothetical protein
MFLVGVSTLLVEEGELAVTLHESQTELCRISQKRSSHKKSV